MKFIHPVVVLLVLAVTGLCTALGWQAASLPIIPKFLLLALSGLAGGCALIAFIAFFVALKKGQKIARNYSALVFVCAACVFYLPSAHGDYRKKLTLQNLEQTYDELAKKGPPFPPADDERFARIFSDQQLISRGYWVSADRQKFEVYYHVYSDSYALAYPERRWDWRGYGYVGPGTSHFQKRK